nr:MAG TPA: HNH endonuclease [Caudoviricetes sp.]
MRMVRNRIHTNSPARNLLHTRMFQSQKPSTRAQVPRHPQRRRPRILHSQQGAHSRKLPRIPSSQQGTTERQTSRVLPKQQGTHFRAGAQISPSKQGKINDYKRRHYHANRAHYVEKMRKYYADNKERLREHRRKYDEANRERIRERDRAWRNANKETVNESIRRWRANNPDKVGAATARRARAELEGNATPKLIETKWEAGDKTCILCGEPIDPTLKAPHNMSRTIEHLTPIARGGRHDIDNIDFAHYGCNAQKQDRTLEEYRERRERVA